jgi:PAS domain S-box-containing protein
VFEPVYRTISAASGSPPADKGALVATVPLPCWIEEAASGRVLDVNAEACKLYGYSRDEFVKRTSASLNAPAGSAGDSPALEWDDGAVQHLTRSGQLLHVALVARETTYGGVAAHLVIALDVTEKRRELRTLLSREERFRTLIEGSSDIIYEADASGRFTFVNSAVREVLGYEPQSLIGRHFTKVIHDEWKALTVEHYLAQRQSSSVTTYFEFAAAAADGHCVWLGQSVQTVRASGAVVGFRAIARDITARKTAEERFNVFMNNSPAPSFMKQSDGRYVYANNLMQRLFVPPGKSLIGRSDAQFLPARTASAIQETDAYVLANNRSVQVVEAIRTAQGVERQWLVHKFPVRDPDGAKCVGGIAVDISDRIALEQELAAARDAALNSARQKSQFLANMSHEIRTPMNGVMGLLGVLLDSNLDADQRDLAETARSSAESLLTIINDILDFSKIEAGKLSFEVADFEVQNVCEWTLDLLADTARRKSLEIGLVLDPGVPAVLRGDSGRLRQVLLNLIGNSIKFTERGGVLLQVEGEAETDDATTLRFRITDTGIGMTEQTCSHLFQPFSQGDDSTTRRFGGTGLGLAISKQLVQMMGGDIGVESEPGCGSTFWFTARFGNGTTTKARPVRRSDAPHVLVVEDSTTSRHIMGLQLTAWGVPNEAADDGMAALALLRDAKAAGQPYGLVISDVHMPGIDGVALARLVREQEKFGAPRFVLMTGDKTSFDAAVVNQLGITTVLRKPVKQQQLFSAVFGESPAERRMPETPAAPASVVVPAHRRILVADDNVVNQKVALRQLQKLGFAADAVGSGLEALDALTRIAYDLVMMDCQMPEMDGYEATAEIRRRDRDTKRHTRILALTASASEGDREKCLAAGMDDFIPKPMRIDEVSKALLRWLPDDRLSTPAAAVVALLTAHVGETTMNEPLAP